MTDRLGFLIWPAVLALVGCAVTGPIDAARATQPPARLTGPITTLVEWKSPEDVAFRCAALQARFGKLPLGSPGCAYAQDNGPITLVLPYDLDPLISHELGHAHQLKAGEPVTHKEYQ